MPRSSAKILMWEEFYALVNSAVQGFLQGPSPSAYVLVPGMETPVPWGFRCWSWGLVEPWMPKVYMGAQRWQLSCRSACRAGHCHPYAAVRTQQQRNDEKGSDVSKRSSVWDPTRHVSPKSWESFQGTASVEEQARLAAFAGRCFPCGLGSSIRPPAGRCSSLSEAGLLHVVLWDLVAVWAKDSI